MSGKMFSNEDIDVLTASSTDTSPCVVIKDNVFDDLAESVLDEVQLLKQHLHQARMNKGDQIWGDENIRGDSLCWVTPELCQELRLSAVDRFVRTIINECSVMKDTLGLTSDYSIQFAVYPGKGEGYNRHRDAFPKSSSTKSDHSDSLEVISSRQLTCLFYLNKDWEPEDGGRLRVFTKPGILLDNTGAPFNFWGVNGYDIDPLFGRLVVFRSELVDHAVLPCFRERMALTFWANGTGPSVQTDSQHQKRTVFCFAAPENNCTASDDSCSSDT